MKFIQPFNRGADFILKNIVLQLKLVLFLLL
nr:MAG TPA: hypothetical protein [Caudoviricetes sp.]